MALCRIILFPRSALKSSEVSIPSILICAFCHCMPMDKILEYEVFPESIVLPLDMESHSISICLRIPNHNICDKSMLRINLHKLQVENEENLHSP